MLLDLSLSSQMSESGKPVAAFIASDWYKTSGPRSKAKGCSFPLPPPTNAILPRLSPPELLRPSGRRPQWTLILHEKPVIAAAYSIRFRLHSRIYHPQHCPARKGILGFAPEAAGRFSTSVSAVQV